MGWGKECPRVENDSSYEAELSYDAEQTTHCASIAFAIPSRGGLVGRR
jgi:hypothetical protein